MLELIFNQTLEDFFFVTLSLFYIIGMVFCFTGLPIIILFWKRWIPKSARTLFWASRRKTPPLLLVHDSGRGELTTIHERKGEGIVMTAQGKYKILPRWLPKIPLKQMIAEASEGLEPSPALAEGQEDAQPMQHDPDAPQPSTTSLGQSGSIMPSTQTTRQQGYREVDLPSIFNIKALRDNFILDYSDWIVKRTNLVGLDLPFFIGYTGKLCLLNPEALALYEAGQMAIRTEDTILFNPKNLPDKDQKDAFQPLLLMDARKIQQIIYEGFDQSQIAAVVADSEELARIGEGMSPKIKILLAIVVIAVVAAAALFILPSIMGGGSSGNPPAASVILQGLRDLISWFWK